MLISLASQYAPWLPARLFADGQQGVWYVPQPVYRGDQVLFQDAAGTTPVTADGDPVGLMLDLSPNGNDASQSTSAARPLYRTDGTLHWLEFDGVDDRLLLPNLAEQSRTFRVICGDFPSVGNNASGVLTSDDADFAASAPLYIRSDDLNRHASGVAWTTSVRQTPRISSGRERLLLMNRATRGGAHDFFVYGENGSENASASSGGTDMSGSAAWYLGPSDGALSQYMNWLFYGGLVVNGGGDYPDQERSRNYFAGLGDVQLP